MSPRPLLKTVSRLVLGLCLGAGVFVARADEPAATQSAPALSPRRHSRRLLRAPRQSRRAP